MANRRLILILLFIPLFLLAQRNELLNSSLKTLIVNRNGEWNSLPVLNLKSRDFLQISFDDLRNEYHRYRYRIEPMTWQWNINENLLPSEFLYTGIDDEAIEDYEESRGTTVYYTHYSFKFPKENTIFKLSGNYRIVIYDDDTEENVAIIPFSILEDQTLIDTKVTTNTDIDFNSVHQQLTFAVQTKPGLTVHNMDDEIHTCVLQNLSPYTKVTDPKPDFLISSKLEWRHSKMLIFGGTNEFHKFELTTLRFGGLGIDNVRWHSPYYHATLLTDIPPKNYIYDEDNNGAFWVKTTDNTLPEIESDYIFTHFILNTGKKLNGDVYIDGMFTNHSLSPEFKMTYNSSTSSYEATILIKQGYYNYQYILDNKGVVTFNETQGDFYQAENRYTIFVYYSQKGSRYDRLIGLKDFKYFPYKN